MRSSRRRARRPGGEPRCRPRSPPRHPHVGEVAHPSRGAPSHPIRVVEGVGVRRHLGGAASAGGRRHRRDEHDDGRGQHRRRRSRQSRRVQAVQLGRGSAQPVGHRPGAGVVELGGAATAVACLLPFTIGSDGGGSTRLPAAYSGVVGLHTTRGLVPHLDYEKPTMMLTASYGPLARDARDAAIVTRVIGGPDGRDYVCIQDDTPDCLAPLDSGVEGMRLAWTDDFGFASRYAGADSARIVASRAMQQRGSPLSAPPSRPPTRCGRTAVSSARCVGRSSPPRTRRWSAPTSLRSRRSIRICIASRPSRGHATGRSSAPCSATTTRSCRSPRSGPRRRSRSGTPRGPPTVRSSREGASRPRTAVTP